MAEAKFKVGDRVHCFRKESKAWYGFDFHGIVKTVANTGSDADTDYEYSVTNSPMVYALFPCLIWEEEMTHCSHDKD